MALIIGIARGVTVIMTNGQITDTVLNAAEQAVSGLGGVAFINLMYLLFLPLSFLIPSSSGLATVAMPIMAPLASFANVPPQLVVTAYQTGNGLVNLVTPTSAVVMGGLAIARVRLRHLAQVRLAAVDHPRRPVHVGHVGRRARQVMPVTAQSTSEEVGDLGGGFVTQQAATAGQRASMVGTDARRCAQGAGRRAGRRPERAEVETRRAKYGKNKFAEAAKEPTLDAFLRQYRIRCRSCCSSRAASACSCPASSRPASC